MAEFCQCCGAADVPLWDICGACGWQNDPELENESGSFCQVGPRLLVGAERELHSSANGLSPARHAARLPHGPKAQASHCMYCGSPVVAGVWLECHWCGGI